MYTEVKNKSYTEVKMSLSGRLRKMRETCAINLYSNALQVGKHCAYASLRPAQVFDFVL